MIDDKKIEEAARCNADKYRNYPTLSDKDRDKVSICSFMEGAKWATNEFLKDLWHPASEIPCEGKYLVVEYNITDTIKDYLSFKRLEGYLGWNWIPYCKSANVTQWLYIDDLLPKKGDNHD